MTSFVDNRKNGIIEAVHRTPKIADPSTWRGRALVPVLVYVGLITSVISSLGAPLVPRLADDYGVPLATAQWSLTITLLVGAVTAPVIGRLSDGPQRLHVLISALTVVTAGSILAALPTGSFALLVTGRGLQGVGLGLIPVAIGIARDHLDPGRARSTLATLSVTAVVGVGLGYPLTGLIAEHLDFKVAFWLAAGLGIIALVLSLLVVPTSMHRTSQTFDVTGALLLGLGLTGLLISISEGEAWGWGSARLLVLATTSIVVVAVWTRHQMHVQQPIIDLRLMQNRSVLTANLAAILAGVGMYLLMSMIIRYVETPRSTGYGLGTSVLVGSLVLLPLSITSYLSTKLATFLSRWLSPGRILPFGMLSFTASFLMYNASRDHLWEIFVVMGLAGVGTGCSFAVMPRMIVNATKPEQTGSALALNQVLRMVGFSIGSALSATVLAAYTATGARFPTDRGFTVGAIVGVSLCTFTTIVAIALQIHQSDPVETKKDIELLVTESVDSAIAGVIAYEPEELPESRPR